MRYILFAMAVLGLGGCQTEAEHNEITDHESCRRLVTQRNDARPEAYKECRDNLMSYRRNGAIADSGSSYTTIVNAR